MYLQIIGLTQYECMNMIQMIQSKFLNATTTIWSKSMLQIILLGLRVILYRI